MAKTRALWDVWQNAEGQWMVQGPNARVDFATEQAARNVAKRGAELDAIEERAQAFGAKLSGFIFGKGRAQ